MRTVMSNLNTDEQRDTLLVLSRMNAHISLLGWTTTESSRTKLAVLVLSLIALCTSPGMAYAQLRGHGGPVRALAISRDGMQALSGSFDTSVIRWSLRKNAADQVLRFHEGAVNAVGFLNDGRIISSGEDARIAV